MKSDDKQHAHVAIHKIYQTIYAKKNERKEKEKKTRLSEYT